HGLEGQGAKRAGWRVAVQVAQRPKREAEIDKLFARRAIGQPVMLLGVVPESSDDLIDGQRRAGRGGMPQPAAGRFPFAADSGVVGATLRRAVFAEKYIAAASSAVGQRDDGLAALFVESVRWNTNMLGHAVGPQLRKSSAPIGVFGRTAQRRQVRT